MNLKKNFSLKAYNTFGIDVRCALFAEVSSTDELREAIASEEFKTNSRLILGGGSNILFTKDFDGFVIKNSLKGIRILSEDDSHVRLKAGAGEVWHELVLFCIQNNYAGIENLSLIPGLVGAAPMQNIGAYGVELVSVFESLEAVHVHTGKEQVFWKSDCEFGYRESVFKGKFKNQFIITSVTLQLNKKPVFNTSYGAICETLEKMGVKELSIKAISDAVIAIRSSKLPDPKVLGNAGSFFKNPEVPENIYRQVKEKFPGVPHYPASNGRIKIPAGWLIEQCGWKGKRIGNTGSHKDQALVLVNYGNASGEEVWSLAMKIKDSVQEKFGIEMVPEVNVV